MTKKSGPKTYTIKDNDLEIKGSKDQIDEYLSNHDCESIWFDTGKDKYFNVDEISPKALTKLFKERIISLLNKTDDAGEIFDILNGDEDSIFLLYEKFVEMFEKD